MITSIMSSKTEENTVASPAYSSDSNDQEFVVTAEMVVDGEDYENTLDEEEDLEEDEDDDELADLQKEGEMPLEQLLQMYYGNNGNEKPEDNNDEMAIKNDQDVLPLENNTINHSAEHSDPFLNQRVTRGLAALNSQYFEEDDLSSDEDYQPIAEDWKKEIQIGENYQAEVPEGLDHYKKNEKTLDNDDKLLWNPNIATSPQLHHYLNIVYKLQDTNVQTAARDDEQALFTLLQMRNVDDALLKRQNQEKAPPPGSLWSEEECQNFEQGLRVFGKDFRLIQKNKVQSRSIGEIVEFYYLWKKTERHDAFVTQTKLGRRKYSLPGIAKKVVHKTLTSKISDMMGRFIEESDSMFSSRSASPSNFSHIPDTALRGDSTTAASGNYAKAELIGDQQQRLIKEEQMDETEERMNHTPKTTDSATTICSSKNEVERILKKQNSADNNTSKHDSWRTSPKPISVGSIK